MTPLVAGTGFVEPAALELGQPEGERRVVLETVVGAPLAEVEGSPCEGLGASRVPRHPADLGHRREQEAPDEPGLFSPSASVPAHAG